MRYRCRDTWKSYNRGWLLLLLCFGECCGELGSTVCICSPAAYDITFDFSRDCDNTALQGDGIVTSDCAIAPFQDDTVTDLIPVSVGSIDILELDANLVLLTQSSRFGTYGDGDAFPYDSISQNPSDVNATNYPRALQISVIGNNAAGEALFFAGLIVFETDCLAYPTLLEGSTIGWIRFVSTCFVEVVCCLLTSIYLVSHVWKHPTNRSVLFRSQADQRLTERLVSALMPPFRVLALDRQRNRERRPHRLLPLTHIPQQKRRQ